MLRPLPLFAAILLLFSILARAESYPSANIQWQKVGDAKLSVLWFDIYNASLYTTSGRFEGYKGPLKLRLNYLRDISQKELIAETDRLLTPLAPPQQRDAWIDQLRQIWPDIEKGDQLVFQIDAQGLGHFYYNRLWIGSVIDEAFPSAFLQIWLGSNSEYPALARQLKGESNVAD